MVAFTVSFLNCSPYRDNCPYGVWYLLLFIPLDVFEYSAALGSTQDNLPLIAYTEGYVGSI